MLNTERGREGRPRKGFAYAAGVYRTRRRVLGPGSGGSSDLLQNGHCATDFGDAEEHERRVRAGFKPAAGIVDVDVRFAELRSSSRELPGPMWKFDLSDLRLRVVQALGIQHSPRGHGDLGGVVQLQIRLRVGIQ